ncbi:ABC transporter substrate-binding protein [Agromyces aerolatus]|uniref:ABC transporter substrate-binding protein n=1 Tax=Agromyces sp. LY-1074 TaxID=3074080 RepID=UPI00285B2536|nr:MULTISPECIES: ABC transporter substrate-binding protein [unclassified Agromyces]MDR5700018.1 ABC transporter substrate-binding protein [Agromyces sp. LY-1074]MDR5706170.1 ABC transporter substrate-binding protein [Agromyces sp. LY-1358]
MTARPRALPAFATAAAVAVALAGCAAGTPTAAGDAAEGGTIVYAHQQEPACVFGGWIEQAYLSANVLDSLLSLDEDGTAVPWLAEEWSVTDDGLHWTFTLKDGVTFTDGSPLTAEAVAFNFDHWVNDGGNGTALAWLGGYYEQATAIDELTLQVDLSRPYPRLPETLTQGYFGIQSQQALETRSDEENCEAPIGTGAFVVDHWDRGQEIVLTRNDDYASPPANAGHTGPAHVEEVVWKFVADPTTRVAALKSGEVDAIYDVPAVQWASTEQAGFTLEKYVTGGRPQQLTFNTAEGPFTDERVRQAFAYSLDREALVETIGRGVIPYEGNGGVSQSTPGWSQKAADRYSFDLDRAEALLDEAGWTGTTGDGTRTKDGEALEIVLPYGAGSIINADGASILQGVQEQAKQAGFKVDLIPVPQAELFSGAYGSPSERDIYPGYWTAVTSGILYVNWRQSTPESPNYNNDSFTNYPELEAIILEANSTADVDAQNALYAEAQEYIAEHALAIGIYDRLSTLAISPELEGVKQEHSQGGPTFYDARFVD